MAGISRGDCVLIEQDEMDRGWRARLGSYDGPESPIGWGNTPEEALESLRVWIGFEETE